MFIPENTPVAFGRFGVRSPSKYGKRVKPPAPGWADNAKAKQLLGWQPSHSGRDGFKRGLAKTAEWFSQADNLRSYKADIYNL
jgi:nucleoside-diphosphate-sugar epimerase